MIVEQPPEIVRRRRRGGRRRKQGRTDEKGNPHLRSSLPGEGRPSFTAELGPACAGSS